MKISLLVLPFQNWSSSPADEFLSDGITEELIYTLTRLEHLRVASRTSSFFFKGKNLQLKEISEQLGISHILEGSLRRYETQIRINIHLTDVNTGFTVWSESFNRAYEDLLRLQDEIATFVAQKFAQAHTSPQPIRSDLVPNNDVKAYEHYLQGLYHYNQYTMEEMHKGVAACERALKRQPEFALAYACIANCTLGLGGYIHYSYYKIAKAAALKAIELNDQLIEPHLAIAMVQAFYDWDWEGAGASVQRALALDIRSADAHRFQGLLALIQGKFKESIYAQELATKYDPMNVLFINSQGWALEYSGRFDDAFKEYERALAIDPHFRPALESMGFNQVYQGNLTAAIPYFERYRDKVGHPLKGWLGLSYVYGKLGKTDLAYEVLALLDQRQAENPKENLTLDYAFLYLGLGQRDKAFQFLQQAVDSHHIWTIARLAIDPIFKELRSDDRYWKMIQQLGLHPYFSSTDSVLPPAEQEIIIVQSDTKEKLSLHKNQLLFIEAQGNYSKFVYLEGQKKIERLLRVSLSDIQTQVNCDYIIQCHRSFLANLHFFDTLIGPSRQRTLVCKKKAISLPISRNKEQLVQQVLTKLAKV